MFDAERAANGLPTNRFPLRREIIVGDTRDDAMATYQSRTHSRYQAYVARGHAVLGGQGMDDEFRRWALDRAFVGSADDCIDQLRGFDPARFGPFVVRPAWPGMSIDDTVAVLDDLGRRVVARCRNDEVATARGRPLLLGAEGRQGRREYRIELQGVFEHQEVTTSLSTTARRHAGAASRVGGPDVGVDGHDRCRQVG